jgi:hypothetical protein
MNFSKKSLIVGRIKFALYLLGLAALSALLIWYGYSHSIKNKIPLALLITEVFYFFCGFFFYPLYQKLQKKVDYIGDKILDEIDIAKKGYEGEKEVFNYLDTFLDNSKYFVHKNLKLPKHNFDIDTVIVSPKGVIVFEIKNYTSQMLFNGGEAFVQVGNEIKPVSPERDPRNELKRHCYFLQKYLAYMGFNEIYVNRAIVFPKRYSASPQKGSKIGVYIISGVDGLKTYIEGLNDNPRFTPEFCAKLNNVLKQ